MNNAKENNIGTENEGLVSELGDILERIAKDPGIGMDYFAICACALELLEDTLGKGYDFPIDIEKIVKSQGIDIVYRPLNEEDRQNAHKIVGKVIIRKNRFTQKDANIMFIDDKSREDEQRYAMAHGLAHYLIHIGEEWYSGEYRVMPMLCKEKDDIVADIFAVFLLIPLPIFLKEFSLYLGGEPIPVRTSEWLKYLSNVTEVPYEDVAIGYQNIRYVFSCITTYQKEQHATSDDNREIPEIVCKHRKNMIRMLEEEKEFDKLFR